MDSKPNTAPPLTNNDVHHHHHHQLDVYKPDPNDDPPGITRQMMTDVKMILKVAPRAKLGCGICKGPEWKPGVFVQFTKENSIARLAGLRPGDQILQCNNFRFTPETAFSEVFSFGLYFFFLLSDKKFVASCSSKVQFLLTSLY